MSAWENVLVEWCNCLDIAKKIEDFTELRNGDFFKNILYIINKSDEYKNEENVFEILLGVLNHIYKNAQIKYSRPYSLLELSVDDLKIITSLLMHYTCIYDRRDILTSPLCHRLSKNTQVCIKSFLEKVDKEISFEVLDNIIKELSTNQVLFKNDDFHSPLMGYLKTPVSKASKFHEKDRELTKLKNMLELERYEKADLQEELRLQIEKLKKCESALNNSNSDIIRLKTQITALESRTPPHFQATDPTDKEKKLKKEIQSLEHYIEKTEKEQEDLREEAYNSRKKLKEWEEEYSNLYAKCSSYEKKVEDLTQQLNNQASRITSLEGYCEELNGLLEEFQAKPANESSIFETSTVSVRRSLTEESLACSVVEVQLKDAQNENREMMKKIDSLNIELDCNKKLMNTKIKEYVARYNKLLEYTENFTDIKTNVSDMKVYCEKERNEFSSYIKEIKRTLISVVVGNYENSIKKLSMALTTEKETSRSLSEKLADTVLNFEECKKYLQDAINEKRMNFEKFEKIIDDLSKTKQELSSNLTLSEDCNKNYLSKINTLEEDNVKYKYQLDLLENEKKLHIKEICNLKNFHNELNVTNKNLTEKLTISEDRIKEYIVQISLSDKVIEDLEIKLKEADSDRSKYMDEIQVLKNDYEQLCSQNKNLSSKLEAAIASNTEYSTRIQTLEENIQLKKIELDVVKSENSECNSKLQTLNKNYENLTQMMEEISQKLSCAEETIKDYVTKMKALEETVELKNYELNQVISDKEEYVKEISNIRHDYENLSKEALELSSENKEKSEQLIEKKIMEEDYMNLIKSIEIYNKELNKVTDLLKTKQYLKDLIEQEEINNISFEEVSKLNCANESRLLEKLDAHSQLGKKIFEINSYIQLNFEKQSEQEKERDNLKEELTLARNSYHELKEITENLRRKLVISEEIIDQHVTKIKFLEENIKLKENEINEVISQKDKYFMQINDIQKNYEEISKKALDLSEENKDKYTQLIEMKMIEEDYIGLKKMIHGQVQELNRIVQNLKCQQFAIDSVNKLTLDNSAEGVKSNESFDGINQLQKQITLINNYTNMYLNEIECLKRELSATKSNYETLTKENRDLTMQLSMLEENNREGITKVKLLEETILQNNDKLNEIISEKDKYVTQISNIQHDFKEMTERALNFSSENKDKHEQLIEKKKIETEYIGLKKTVDLYAQQLNKFVKHLASQQIVKEINNAHSLFDMYNKRLELNSSDVIDKEKIGEENEVEENITKIKEYVHLYIKEIEYLNKELVTARNNYQILTEKTDDLKSKLAASEESISEYSIKIESLEKIIEQKNDMLNEVISEKNNYATQMLNIQRNYEESTKRTMELLSENKEKDKLLIEKKIIEQDYINIIKTIAMYNVELNKVVNSLKCQQPVLETSDFQRSCNSFNKLIDLNSPVKSKTSGELDEINQLGEQISRINSYIHLYSEKETFYLNEIDNLKGELASSSSNYFEAAENLKEQNSDNETLITSLTENLHSVIEKYNYLQEEHRDYLSRINEYEIEITKMKKTHSDITLTNELKITNLQDEILKLEGEILSAKKIHDNITEAYESKIKLLEDNLAGSDKDVNLLRAELEALTNEYQEKVNTLEIKTTALEEEKKDLEEKLQHLRNEYELEAHQFQSNILNKEELIKSLKQQCEENEAKISTLRVQMAMVKEELSQVNSRSGKTEEEYQSTLANLQVQVVASKLEVTKLSSKLEALQVEKEECERQLKFLEEARNTAIQDRKTVSQELEKERELNIQMRNELSEKYDLLSELGQYKDLQEKYEKLQRESLNQKFLEEKQIELQQKVETLMKSNEVQKQTYEVFKIYFKEFREKLDKLLSQKNILERITNNLRVLVVSINKNTPIGSVHLKTLFQKKDAMEVIAEDIMKHYNRCSKQINDIVFDVMKYYEKTCDDLLSTLDIKIENYSEKYNLEELDNQISDLTERTTDALEQVKILQKDLENLSSVDTEKVQKENILGTSRQINVDKMKEDELKKKNLILRQKVTLLENSKSNLEKTLKKLREENKKIKEGCDKSAPTSDAHYNMLLQEYVAFKEKHSEMLQEYKTKLELLQKEYEEHKSSCMRTTTALGNERDLPSEAEKQLTADLNNLREAYSSIRAIKAKLETENLYSKKLIEEQKEEIDKFNFMKEAYDKLLEENSKLMTDVDTMKYKRTRDRDEFLRLLRKERSENESKNSKQLQEIRNDYEGKLEKMKEKMIKLYRDEVNKEMSKVKAGQHESTSLLKIIEQLKGDLFEAEQKIQVIEAERDMLKRGLNHTNLRESRESFSSLQLHDSDSRSLKDFPASSVCSSRAFSGTSRTSVEFKHPHAFDARRQSEVRRVSTLPRTGTVVEELTLTRRTSFGVPDSIGPNLHMEDEEEMFNNKYLADLKQGRCDLPASDDRGSRVSELAWRNSLVPPHLKSSYPAEMQFCSPSRFKDDDIKTGNLPFDDSLSKLLPGEKPRKKDFGTTSYKKPGPPTPSKNGGRLSLQGNEVHPAREPPPEPKKSTPGRIRALFTSKNNSRSSTEVSPPKRRLNIFRR